MKSGDIVKLTKLYARDDGEGPQCLRYPSWGRIVQRQEDTSGKYWDFNWLWPRLTKEGRLWTMGRNLGVLQENYDEFEIVPESQVPDRVWAETAKRVLLDENPW